MDPMDEIRQTFFVECEELLEGLEAGLMEINEGEHDDETVNSVFRAVHSIKGGAGAFALDHLVKFAHTFETTLDEVRSKRLEPTAEVMAVFLRCSDVLNDLVANARDGSDAETDAAVTLMGELGTLAGGPAPAAEEPDAEDAESVGFTPLALSIPGLDPEPDFVPQPLSIGLPLESVEQSWALTIRPLSRFYELGNEIALLMRALSELGEMKVDANSGDIPPLDRLDGAETHLTLEVRLVTTASHSEITEIFEFVDTECELTVVALGDEEEEAAGVEILAAHPVAEEATETATPPAPPPPAAPRAAPGKTGASAEDAKSPTAGAKPTVRVEMERVDRLINLVGELVINQAAIADCIGETSHAPGSASGNALEEFRQLTRDIQDSVMAIRTQPVKPLFQRMQRIVREAAAATGKTVRLKTCGEATEVDKTVIERLGDPLMHMVRNAVDHGLEPTERRLDAGKDAEGVVTLTAVHRSGRVVIEISDDGAGIDRERVRAKAIEKGLISEDDALSPTEIEMLLFAPGFSTAAEVSALSGRGVGMDVVKQAIQALGGRVSISSRAGAGTTFSISLPLTLAVLDGMIVTVEGHTLVVPLSAIAETFKPAADQIHALGSDATVVSVRDSFVPVIDLAHAFGYVAEPRRPEAHVVLLVETEEHQRAALLVDSIVDQRQVVIKGLEENYGHVPGISAATILGDGRIALIIDTAGLIDQVRGPVAAVA